MASAKRLRRQRSLPEMLLWRLLRLTRRKLRFRKQHAIGPFVADFYCRAAKTVIEIDGAIRNGRQDTDGKRDAYMASLGIAVIRIPAADVLADPEAVVDGVLSPLRRCSWPLHHSASRLSGPPPHCCATGRFW